MGGEGGEDVCWQACRDLHGASTRPVRQTLTIVTAVPGPGRKAPAPHPPSGRRLAVTAAPRSSEALGLGGCAVGHSLPGLGLWPAAPPPPHPPPRPAPGADDQGLIASRLRGLGVAGAADEERRLCRRLGSSARRRRRPRPEAPALPLTCCPKDGFTLLPSAKSSLTWLNHHPAPPR